MDQSREAEAADKFLANIPQHWIPPSLSLTFPFLSIAPTSLSPSGGCTIYNWPGTDESFYRESALIFITEQLKPVPDNLEISGGIVMELMAAAQRPAE